MCCSTIAVTVEQRDRRGRASPCRLRFGTRTRPVCPRIAQNRRPPHRARSGTFPARDAAQGRQGAGRDSRGSAVDRDRQIPDNRGHGDPHGIDDNDARRTRRASLCCKPSRRDAGGRCS